MENTVLKDREVREHMERFVRVRLYTDRQTEASRANRALEQERYGTVALPLYVFLAPDGTEVARLPRGETLPTVADFLDAMERAQAAADGR